MQQFETFLTPPIPDSIEVSAISSYRYNDPEIDDLYSEAVRFVIESRIASVSAVQRRFKIGYNRSSKLWKQKALSVVLNPMEEDLY